MKKIIKLSVVTIGLLLITGCTPPKVEMSESGTINDIKTDYTQALRNIDPMIAVFNGKPVSIFIKPIADRTASGGKLPRDISTVVKKSFNSIGSNVKTMFTINMKNPPKNKFYIIEGAITEFDLVKVAGSGRDAAGQGTYNNQKGSVDFGMDQEDKLTKLAITFNPQDPRTGNYVPNASTSNRIEINQKSAGNEVAISILGSGIGLNNSLTKAQGIHSSINILVELSVVELLGKLTNYPYWLLTRGKVNQDIVAHLSRRFLRDRLNQKIQKISYLLSLRNTDIQTTTMMNSTLKQAIINYKVANGMAANDIISTKLYKSLLGA
jgi:hypothetical protein